MEINETREATPVEESLWHAGYISSGDTFVYTETEHGLMVTKIA